MTARLKAAAVIRLEPSFGLLIASGRTALSPKAQLSVPIHHSFPAFDMLANRPDSLLRIRDAIAGGV
jgi:hypothetical protein